MSEVRADAPGRVNLIGEHTDYHEGFVLPSAVPLRTHVELQPRSDRRVFAWSTHPGAEPVEYTLGDEQRRGTWSDYIQGVTWELARRGVHVEGFDLHVRSDVPVGSGLSSSAALEVALLRALRCAFAVKLSDVELAQAAQRAEVEFVGAPVGIMDQMASSLAGEREALFLDTRTLQFERVALPRDLDLVVIDSGITHHHASGGYVVRRHESEEAARRLGVRHLRDVGIDVLPRLSALPDVLGRRARHVITENARVLQARDALVAGDLARLGHLLHESHASMRDDYEVSMPPIDLIVDLASAHPHVFGARLTGGGFGGAIVIAAAGGTAAIVGSSVAAAYRQRTEREVHVLLPLPI